MVENLIQVKSFGTLRPETLYSKDVSLSFDTIQHAPESEIKVLVQIEPPEIINRTDLFIKHKNDFDLILTWDEKILRECENSKKFIFGTCWIDEKNFNPKKEDEISFIMSGKNQAPGHRIRHAFWNVYGGKENINGFRLNKYRTPPRIESKNILFDKAKYHITIENTKRVNWVTEKIIDCFATKTIPIYYGCPNIGEFFNEKGIISFNDLDELDGILNKITPEFYDEISEVLEENYQKSKQYYDFHKRVEKEINNLIKNK